MRPYLRRADPALLRFIETHTTPEAVQWFINTLPYNACRDGYVCKSPAQVLEEGTAHCLEGGLLGHVALSAAGIPCSLVNLRAPGDIDHVILVYYTGGYVGSIAQSSLPGFKERPPIFPDVASLAADYSDAYGQQDGRDLLVAHSVPFDPAILGWWWLDTAESLEHIGELLDALPHRPIRKPDRARIARVLRQ